MSVKPLQLAVVGTGAFGSRYLRSLESMSGTNVAWVCSATEAEAREAAGRFHVPRFTADLAEVCADAGVDAVIVVTPEHLHREIAVRALDAGKHVIVEKPLATNEEDGAAMIEAARRSGKRLMTSFLLRFDYRYAQLKQRLEQIGTVRNIYAYRNFDRSLFDLYHRTHSFVENAIHDIDLILWYVGSPVEKVHGFCRNTLGRSHPDVNWGVLEFANGCLAVLQTSWLYPPQAHEDLQWNAGIQVMGDRGVLEAANDRGGFRANTEGDGILLLDQTGWADIHGEPRGAFGAMLRHYLRCLRNETPYQGPTPEEAMEAMRVACRLVEASGREEFTR